MRLTGTIWRKLAWAGVFLAILISALAIGELRVSHSSAQEPQVMTAVASSLMCSGYPIYGGVSCQSGQSKAVIIDGTVVLVDETDSVTSP
ncbi:MAG TPA: hypothetical protein VNL15_04815 [Dehalococcoidia bacterium]|nr:hypothetical protein [Dehalococcoidia bacterium]